VEPDTAFAFSTGSGFEDLVVGNEGDGALALFDGGADGLSLMSVEIEPGLPAPTDLAFSALTGGSVDFYAATAGRESAELVALSLSVEVATVTGVVGAAPETPTVQLVAVPNDALPLVATVLTLTINVTSQEEIFGPAESEALAAVAVQTGSGTSVGQPVLVNGRGGGGSGDEPVAPDEPEAGVVSSVLSPWERFVLGLDEALEEFRRQNAPGVPGNRDAGAAGDREGTAPSSSLPAQGAPTGARLAPDPPSHDDSRDGEARPGTAFQAEAIDAAIETPWSEDARTSVPLGTPSSGIISRTRTRSVIVSRDAGSSEASPSQGGDGAAPSRAAPESGTDGPRLLGASLWLSMLAAGRVRPRHGHRTELRARTRSRTGPDEESPVGELASNRFLV
jgi:hypothetical protein